MACAWASARPTPVGRILQQPLYRQLPAARAAPQQICARGLRLAPVLVAVEAPIGQAQHARRQTREQWLAQFPLAGVIRTQVGAQDGVGDALHQNRAARLRVAGHTGAAARAAELRDVVFLVGQLETAAVQRNQAQPSVKGSGVHALIGLVEGGITVAVVRFVERVRPETLEGTALQREAA